MLAIEELAIVARGVTRRFDTVEALRGADLAVPYGQVTALVGPNGVGKTTLLLILATLLPPDSGTVRIAGRDARTDPAGVRARMGWMPDVLGVYDQLRVREYLAFFARAYNLGRAHARERIDDVLALTRLDGFAGRPVSVLSRGQKQRLALCRALLHQPSVLLLDEPAAGLDPRSRAELCDLLRGLASGGAAVLISSHVLTELEEIADRVVFLSRGCVVGDFEVAELAGFSAVGWRVRAHDPLALHAALERRSITGRDRSVAGVDLPAMTEAEAAGLLAGLIGEGVPVVAYGPVGSRLETAYLALTEERS